MQRHRLVPLSRSSGRTVSEVEPAAGLVLGAEHPRPSVSVRRQCAITLLMNASFGGPVQLVFWVPHLSYEQIFLLLCPGSGLCLVYLCNRIVHILTQGNATKFR
jgi:hypothetical protein